jgi:putative CocE/NonD family hydrolase
VWLPADAEAHPVPAILEYLPYRKDDGTARRDALHHPYFAAHGYAGVRVDMRGSGDSEGILLDEYLPREQDDALEIMSWISAQPWCNGSIGMIGISWGGFNGLQVAARRPPQLKAVISLCSTDDRYADDVHFIGGCLMDRNVGWANTMLGYNARPPDPMLAGERWRELWLDRLERTPSYAHDWLAHQHYDAFWKHASIRENFDDVTCPVYLVGGWADGYPNAIPRMLAGLSSPRKALIGPWGHQYPHIGVPGPAIGFLQECLRWWDYWLKGIDTGIMREPMLRAWMQESVEPRSFQQQRPGRWVAEPSWPSPHITEQRYLLSGSGTLDLITSPTRHSLRADAPPAPRLEAAASLRADAPPRAEQRLDIRGVQYAGFASGSRTAFGRPGDFPPDQRAEDGLSLTFTSAPLSERLEILGYPMLTLALSADRPLALVAARLCDVAPDGASTLMSRGLLNLTHRDSREQPSALVPGERYSVQIQLNVVGYAIPAGHRLRVALSPTYWPMAWPSPEPVTLSVFCGSESFLELPARPPRGDDADLAAFGPPQTAPPLDVEVLRPSAGSRSTSHDAIAGVFEQTILSDDGSWRQRANNLEYESTGASRFRIVDGDPLSARLRCERSFRVGRGDWQTRVEVGSELTSDTRTFHLVSTCDVFEGEARIFSRTWTDDIPRNLV